MSSLLIFFLIFRPENEIAFSVLFIIRPKTDNPFTVGLYIKSTSDERMQRKLKPLVIARSDATVLRRIPHTSSCHNTLLSESQ